MMRLILTVLIIVYLLTSQHAKAAAYEEELKELKVVIVSSVPLEGRAALLLDIGNKTEEGLDMLTPIAQQGGGKYKIELSYFIGEAYRGIVKGIRIVREEGVNVSLALRDMKWNYLLDIS